MRDLSGPLNRAASDAKLDRYWASFGRYGLSHWVIESRDGAFLGYTGVKSRSDHAIGALFDLAWRLARHACGHCRAAERFTLATLHFPVDLERHEHHGQAKIPGKTSSPTRAGRVAAVRYCRTGAPGPDAHRAPRR
jgi:hypothetical protein